MTHKGKKHTSTQKPVNELDIEEQFSGEYIPGSVYVVRNGKEGWVIPEEAIKWYSTMDKFDQPQWKRLQQVFAALGLSTEKKKMLSVLTQAAVYAASVNNPTTNNRQGRDPVSYINDALSMASGAGTSFGGTQNSKYTTTQSAKTLESPSDITDLARKYWVAEVGREPSDKELATFIAKVQAGQKADKGTVTTTTGTSKSVTKGTSANSTSTNTQTADNVSKTGQNWNVYAQDYARSMPDYAENKVVSTFLSILDRVLTGDQSIAERILGGK